MNLKKYNIRMFILKLLFIISSTIVTFFVLNAGTTKQRAVCLILSFLISTIAVFKFKIIEKIFNIKNVYYSGISIFFALITSFFIAKECYTYNMIIEPVRSFLLERVNYHGLFMYTLIILSLYALYVYYYYFFSRFLPRIIGFFKDLSKEEKVFLITSTIIFSIGIIIIYSITNVFYEPRINDEIQTFDVLYSTDTGGHALLNDYLNINSVENDLRQPLFAVFSFPFAIVPYIIGSLFNIFKNTYFILIAIEQVFLMNILCIMIGKMLNLKKLEKVLFMISYVVTYPFILFAFNLEQYVFSIFWLFCFIYYYIQNNEGNKFYFIASIGSLLTNSFFFPFLTSGRKIKQWIKDFVQTGICFFSAIVMFGQLPVILNLFTGAGHVSNYIYGKIEFNTFCQYTNFLKNCFIAPFNVINEEKLGHISYQISQITSLDLIGIVIFILAILGFILNYKNKFAKICISWVGFSIILLVLLGYGTRENGLILYSLYFSWAFVSLVFLFFNKILKNHKKVLISLYSLMIISMLIINANGLIDLIKFGIQNFDHVI